MDGGRFSALAEYFLMSGKIFATAWKGDVDKRVLAAGGSQEDADFIYDTFHDLVRDAKTKKSKAAAPEGGVAKPRAFGGLAKKKEGGDEDLVVINGKGSKQKANLMYGDGLSAECVENS